MAGENILRDFVEKSNLDKNSLSAGFEPARVEPNRFLIYRLNHSATTTA